MTSPNQIPAGILFGESYILALRIEPYILELKMDYFLTPEHTRYAAPGNGEYGCYVRGRLLIQNFRKVGWKATGIRPGTDATGEIDFGCLDDLVHFGNGWKLTGDFGMIEVDGGNLVLVLDD